MDRNQLENGQKIDIKLLGTREKLGGNQIENGQAMDRKLIVTSGKWIENRKKLDRKRIEMDRK